LFAGIRYIIKKYMTMKNNTIFYFLIFIILLGLQSCATDPLLKRYIVGSWQPVKLGSVDIKKLLPRDDTLPQQFTQEERKMLLDLKQNLSKPGANGTSQKSTVADLSLLINEANTSYKFTSEGFGARFNPGQPIKGKWKLKKKGTKLILTEVNTQEQFILLIDSLSSNKMVATNKNLPNGLKITYKKGK
jgi:hypothetical protein